MSYAEKYAKWVLDPANVNETGHLIKLAAHRFLDDLKREDIYFDEEESMKMINFCERYCYQWEGDWRGRLLQFEPWQKFIFQQVFGWFRKDTGSRRITEVYVQVSKKNGKALDVNTKIPTPAGWRTMLDLQVGDWVFGDDGKPTRILAVSELMNKESFEIEFQCGQKIIASGDHLWEVECNNWKLQKDYVSKRKPCIVDTNALAERYANNEIKGHNIIHVKTCRPVEYPPAELLINPYLLGCWLGDGDSAASRIVVGNSDEEIVHTLRQCGMSVTAEKSNRSAPNYKIGGYNEFVSKLRLYNLFKNKHIPIPYLQSSTEQRWELLKGLMDTDGYISKTGQCSFTNTNKTLSDDVLELCLSLGIKASQSKAVKKCQTGATCIAYNVNFYEDRPVFKLTRKLQRQKEKLNHRSRFRVITSIKSAGVRLVKCISVDNESHLYLAGEHFIPTHNSTMCAGLMNFHIFADDRVNTPKVFTAANNEDQAKICVNMAGRIIEQSPDLYDFVDDGQVALFNYKDNITEVVHKGKDGFIKAFAKETSDKKSKTAGGKHGVNASLGVVDEFGMSPDHGASKPIKTSMASRREGLMFYITTAGFNMDGPCYQELRKVGIQVLEGVIKKDNYLPIIFEMDEGDDWKDERFWRKCAPNLDISVNRDFLREMVSDAVTYGGTTEVDVKTLNFNMWVDSPNVFISDETWKKNSHGISESDLEGQLCYGGYEFVSGKNLNAFCLLFPDIEGKIVVKPIFWAPSEFLNNSRETDQYKNWKDKFITSFDGNTSDNDLVFELLMDEISKYQMNSFAYKKGIEHNDIVQSLIKNGVEGNPLSHGYQGISTPTLAWEEMLTAGQIEHFNNPVLAWMNSNCTAGRKDNDIRIEKSGSRVVGIYAAINALAQWKTKDAGEQYDDQLIEIW